MKKRTNEVIGSIAGVALVTAGAWWIFSGGPLWWLGAVIIGCGVILLYYSAPIVATMLADWYYERRAAKQAARNAAAADGWKDIEGDKPAQPPALPTPAPVQAPAPLMPSINIVTPKQPGPGCARVGVGVSAFFLLIIASLIGIIPFIGPIIGLICTILCGMLIIIGMFLK